MILKDHTKRINDFEEYMSGRLEEINIISSKSSLLFKRILYVSFLDSISACVFPNRKNKSRFIGLIDRFSNWEDRNRVCIYHLAKFCTLNTDPELKCFRDFCFEKLKSLVQDENHTSVVCVSENPKFDDAKKYWPRNSQESQFVYSLTDFKLVSLLYQQRNSLVHQFQVKGDELGPMLPEKPFYMIYKDLGSNNELVSSSLELVYPVKFMSSLCTSVLKNTINYFRESDLDPFSTYYAGEFWLNELNK